MKQTVTILTVIFISISFLLPEQLIAQTPEAMSYQAIVRDMDDMLVADQQVGMQISILHGAPDGTAVYVEIHYPITNANGLATLQIGNGYVVSGDYLTIDWANGPYFIKTEADLEGGEDFTITGTSPLLSVPYALHARVADSIAYGGVENDPIFSESVAFGITEADTSTWNNKLDKEVDGDPTNELQIIDIFGNTIYLTDGGQADLPPETDPVFDTSVAGGITAADTAAWNAGGGAETDPIFGASVAAGISAGDTTFWNHHTDSTDVANMGFPAGAHTDSTDIALMGYIAFYGLSQNATGQITISDNGGTTPDPSAILDLQSTTKGFLVPEMNVGEMIAIPNAPAGLMVRESNSGRIFIKAPGPSSVAWYNIITSDINYIDALQDGATNEDEDSHYIGNQSGTGFINDAHYTTAVGYRSGIGFGNGLENTAIGAKSGPANGTQNLRNTTTLGYEAKAEYSHQVVLGTTSDTVIIPRALRIKAHDVPSDGHLGTLYVEEADSNLYYHNGNDWQQLNDDDYKVGDFALGGVIFYVDESGKHGLVCNVLDPSSSIRWAALGAPGTPITYAEGDGIYAGEMNTAIAVAALGIDGENSALQVSANWRTSSPFATNYGDWYLPSREELVLMYTKKDAINATLNAGGWGTAIGTGTYWSSTEYHDAGNVAHAVDFSNGNDITAVKQTLYHMRPIRKF